MKETFILYIFVIFLILLLNMGARKLKIAAPLLLVPGGLLLSWIPALSHITIDPELIFLIFLPPLLYEAAWFTSWKEMWRWRRVISVFAVLIVILTSGVVAVVSVAWIPGFTLALGFLLGGIVSPPDAVSATSVMRLVRVPKRITHILEGESLLNDASSLIIFRFALAAVDTGRFVVHEAIGSFLLVIVLGIAVGVAIAMIYYAIHRWLPTTPDIDIVLTLTAPYVMYIAAESIHVSGVLSVVSGSLFLSTRSYQILSHRSRLRGANVWSTIGFVLNGLVFMLIGLELPEIVRQLGTVSLWQAIGYSLGIKGPLIVGWAGMRGVVSLAAALSIPYTLAGGGDFPERDLIIFITFMVIVLTLLVQGLTLPALVRRLNWKDPDHQLSPEQQDLKIRKQLTAFSLAWLKEHCPEKIESNPLLKQLKGRYYADNVQLAQESHDVQEEYKYYYLKLIKKERQFLLDLNKKLENDEEIIRKYQDILDLEQEKLLYLYEPGD